MNCVVGCKRLLLIAVLLSAASLVWGQNTTPANKAQTSPAKTAQPVPVTTAAPAPTKAATSATSAPASNVADSSSTASGEILIGAGDLLKVGVIGAADFDQEVRVASNGDAGLALIGNVHLAGLTPDQASQLIRKRLLEGKYFADPQVTVFEKEYATQGVAVLGEVQKPGVYPLIGPHRLFDVLSQAGGTTVKAGEMVTITRQNQPQSPQVVTMSPDPNKNNEANVEMRPGDTVVVSKAGIVYVVGDVHKPSGFVMESHGMTVLQAIAMAEGPSNTAALNNAKIIRPSATGQPAEIHLELKKMLQAKAPDVRLQAEDIVFVPGSTAKKAGATTLDTIMRVATGVAVYRVP
jgi:polysaccharide biosynthesis/export protein